MCESSISKIKKKREEKSPLMCQLPLKIKDEYKNKFPFIIDFDTIVKNGDVFIDKTLFIKEILDTSDKAILITRPSKWGKTFNMNMLRTFLHPHQNKNDGSFKNLYIFTGGKDNVNLDNLDESKCLKIMTIDHGKYREMAGKIPTIFVTFSHILDPTKSYTNPYDYCVEQIKKKICEGYLLCSDAYCQYLEKIIQDYYSIVFQANYDIKNPTILELELEVQKHNIPLPDLLSQFACWTKNSSEIILNQALMDLAKMLFEFYGTKPYIIIDDYDSPVNNISNIDDKRDILNLIMNVLQPIIKDGHRHVKKAILTGIYELSTASLHSSQNNLTTFTLQDSTFLEFFGFTKAELNELLEKALDYENDNDLLEQKKLIKEWYKGYNVGNYKIYSPWSINKCLNTASKQDRNPIQHYWVHIGGQNPLISIFNKIDDYAKLFKLINTGRVWLEEPMKTPYFNFNYDNRFGYESDIMSLWSILLHTGYLTPYKADDLYTYKIPNKEVKVDFYNSVLIAWIDKKTNQSIDSFSKKAFIDELENWSSFQKLFQSKILDKLNDYVSKTESYFHSLINAILQIALIDMEYPKYKILNKVFNKFSKKVNSIFIPNIGQGSTVIIHEYKKLDFASLQEAKAKAEDALWQIYSKKYVDIVLAFYKEDVNYKYFTDILARGIVFYKPHNKQTWNVLIKEHQITIDEAIEINNHFSIDGNILKNHSLLSGEKHSRHRTLIERKAFLSENYRCLDDLILRKFKNFKRTRFPSDNSQDENPSKKKKISKI